MTGRAYVHWRNADTNLAEIHEEMSELVDKQVNVQKGSLKKTSGVHAKLPQAHEKVCDENERNKQRKNDRRLKLFFDGRKEFIRRVRETRVMDIKRLQINDSSYIEGTLFSKRVNT